MDFVPLFRSLTLTRLKRMGFSRRSMTKVSNPTARFEFDDAYLNRLRDDDPETANHFASHFGRLLNWKLRLRYHDPELIDDVRQETLRRVREVILHGELHDPKRLEDFVCAVHKN